MQMETVTVTISCRLENDVTIGTGGGILLINPEVFIKHFGTSFSRLLTNQVGGKVCVMDFNFSRFSTQ